MTRRTDAPGVEYSEIDRSQYDNKPDYSLPNAPTIFMTGFADRGEDYTTKWINSKQTLVSEYGYPTNEPERYFYNGACEILERGGVLMASKLPYDNLAYDSFSYTDYKVLNPADTSANADLSDDILTVDSSLTSYSQISAILPTKSALEADLLSIDLVDSYRTRSSVVSPNTIRIVDLTRGKYDKIDLEDYYIDNSSGIPLEKTRILLGQEVVGILPVITTPLNAMYYQGVIEEKVGSVIADATTIIEDPKYVTQENVSLNLSNYTVLGDIRTTQDREGRAYNQANYTLALSSEYLTDTTVSKIAASYFPAINFKSADFLERRYLKQIGVVVFKMYKDSADSNKIRFAAVESFVGSLDKSAKDETTQASIFIDDIINDSSKYINFFSNIRLNFDQIITFWIRNQVATSLGLTEAQTQKKISYIRSIIRPLTMILDNNKDPNRTSIDLVVDAGVSNIAQNIKIKENTDSAGEYDPSGWTITSRSDTTAWQAILRKFDDFCKYTRRDCMFIADILRPFCLSGREKLIRWSDPTHDISNSILPQLKYMTALNSSFSAGYCDWFQQMDDYSGQNFWCPPSIKAAGICTYCDVYFHPWDAPAGMTRGIVHNVSDVAFSPTVDEAGKLYNQCWNYAVSYPIDGIIMEGQKTFQMKKTALDRINVRRLMLYLEKKVIRIAKYFLYEGNTPYLRQRFVDTIKPIFDDAVAGYGISKYAIKCDDELNTTEVIDHNEIRCRIALIPVKTAEWICLDFICTNQSASVDEQVMK